MNILSLDPMYSPLHQMIMDEAEDGGRFCILSSFGLSVYFSSVHKFYFNKELDAFKSKVSTDLISLISNIPNHYRNLRLKVDNRALNEEELNYFCCFYLYFESFILNEDIDLVLLHNDLRWQHSIAIEICKKYNVNYLVTEQGLFRPYTTIVDDFGVNAFSQVKLDFENKRKFIVSDIGCNIKSTHNSFFSYYKFTKYLLLSKLGKAIGYDSKYVHKRHTISEYVIRFCKQNLFVSKNVSNDKFTRRIVFVPLQLELDTQLLIHSDFNNNEEVIENISSSFFNCDKANDYDLVFKLHPNDTQNYKFDPRVKITKSIIDDSFLDNVDLVISVNSTAVLNVLETKIPVITIGRSIYDVEGVAQYSSIDKLSSNIDSALRNEFSISNRKNYIEYLKKEYSIHGAGYDYPVNEIKKILRKLS
ncbi:capsular polysaccharide export protein, LipB/KpsS family [Aliivibrio fischeri]|uniref:capsular polysaccharide export protein, LipB/KpsS family n=1 Tax=Aliivibrio fischeri TaxID=668 RepID=UPI0012D8E40F|nr:hypothetical protein [Aliivibrio fischeri]MUI52510.1 hypothetical protein [Aliivibrio fischeri]